MPQPVIAIGYDALDNPSALYVGYSESAALSAIQAAGGGATPSITLGHLFEHLVPTTVLRFGPGIVGAEAAAAGS